MNDYYIKDFTHKGRGVFASKDFTLGQVIESSPVVIFSYEASVSSSEQMLYVENQKILVKTEIHKQKIPAEIDNIIFAWSFLTKNGKKESCIALGVGSLFNSANPANLRVMADEKNKNLLFIATRDIKKDEELTINYSGISGHNISENNHWFDERNIDFKE